MKISLPALEKIEVKQSTAALDERRLDGLAQLLLLVPKRARAEVPDALPYAAEINARLKRGGWRKPPAQAVVELPNARGTRVVVGFVDADCSTFARHTGARKLIETARREPTAALAVIPAGLEAHATAWADALVAAAGAATFELPSFKQPEPRTALARLEFLGLPKRCDFSRTLAAVQGNNLARWLGELPGNALTPAVYRRLVAQLAKRHGWQVETLDERALARKGCGAFLAVVQASTARDAAIVRLKYRPAKRARKTLALVGKGLCYDTGGINLKTARHMYGMHQDMLGSAVALGTLLALTELEAPFAIDCWLAIAQNHIGPDGYKPNDVVRACDGTTIEVAHTDAEGRMALADTLALVARTAPDLTLDYATLTGSCVQALGTRYTGAFSNRDALHPQLVAAGVRSGERVWPFPQDPDYDKAIESKVADIKQCCLDNEADHIIAARFLGRFITDKLPWVHLDLAASNCKGGLGAVATENTGFGVRWSLEVLLGDDAIV